MRRHEKTERAYCVVPRGFWPYRGARVVGGLAPVGSRMLLRALAGHGARRQRQLHCRQRGLAEPRTGRPHGRAAGTPKPRVGWMTSHTRLAQLTWQSRRGHAIATSVERRGPGVDVTRAAAAGALVGVVTLGHIAQVGRRELVRLTASLFGWRSTSVANSRRSSAVRREAAGERAAYGEL